MKIQIFLLSTVVAAATFVSFAKVKKSAPVIKEEKVTYTVNGKEYIGYVSYDQSIKGKRPTVVVIPEWWGLNDYPRMRAKQLAELGYFAMAIDVYGGGVVADNPQAALKLATPFYQDPTITKTRLDASIALLKGFEQSDNKKIAAIGYCFGGFFVLNCAKLGSDLKGVVSFHGGLSGVKTDKNLLKAQILVCHGGDDKNVPQKEVNAFRHEMDSIGAKYSFIVYPNATHAFTNPAATETGEKFNIPIAYNAEADKKSWEDMKTFLAKVFK
jgi:dienelactone hydrolase